MSDKILDSEIISIDNQDDVDSFPHRTNYANIKNRHNSLVDTLAASTIGTTNAETTAARPYHVDLTGRLNQIADQLDNVVTNGGAVTESTIPDLNVEIALTVGTVGGIQVNTAAQSLGPFVAPTNKRYVVICQNSDNTFNGELGSDVADPILPNVGSTQRPLFYFLLESSTTAITNAMLIDCREQGLTVNNKWFWQISDAITTLNQGSDIAEGYTLDIHKGTYIEEVDISGYFNLHFNFEKGTYFQKVNGSVCFKSINLVTNETYGNKITGCTFLHDGTVVAEKMINFDFTDGFEISDCRFDDTVAGDQIAIDNSDEFSIFNCYIDDLKIDDSNNFIIKENTMVGFDIGLTDDCSKFRLDNNIIDDYSVTTTISAGSSEYLEDGHHKNEVSWCGVTAQLSEMKKKGWTELTAMGTRFIKANQTAAGGTGGDTVHSHKWYDSVFTGQDKDGAGTDISRTGSAGGNTDAVAIHLKTGSTDYINGDQFTDEISSEPLNYELIPLIHR